MLRIIAGKYRGKKLNNIEELDIRPTKGRAKEALFSILNNDKYSSNNKKLMTDAIVLDLCCGSGALGIEAISRGASKVFFIDNNEAHLAITTKNINSINEQKNSNVIKGHISNLPLAKLSCNLVFIDPPYNKNLIGTALHQLKRKNWLSNNAIIICECGAGETIEFSEDFLLLDEKKYGKTKFIILQLIASEVL